MSRHGHYLGYITDKCRQPCCTEAWRAYQAKRSRDIAYRGRTVKTRRDPAKAQTRILELRARGIGARTIETATGISASTIDNIANGRRKWISAETEHAILTYATPPIDTLADRARLEATGTHRRIRALQAIGWSLTDLGDRLGCTGSNIGETLHSDRVRAKTVRAIAALYDELWDKPAPKGQRRTKTLKMARDNGWAPPAAWDDDSIDDPTARPYVGTSERRTGADIAEDVEFLLVHHRHATSLEIGERLGYSDQSGVQNALRRAGRVDLLATLARNAEIAGLNVTRRSA